jgi:ribosomal protein S18 acetylase RimI-like enzyme
MATPEDAELLAELSETTFRHTYAPFNRPGDIDLECERSFSKAVIEAELQDPDIRYWLAREDETALGYVKLRFAPCPSPFAEGKHLEVSRLYVRETAKGRGIGKRLLDQALATARQSGCNGVWLGVWKENLPAIGFYEKRGFRLVGETTYLLGEDLQYDWVMGMAF